jgi:hypothetical protein
MLIPYNPDHLKKLDLAPNVAAVLAEPGAVENLEFLADKTLCATVVTRDGETVLGLVGAVPVPGMNDVCEVFVVSTHTQKRHPRTFVQGVRRAIEIVAPGFAIIRTVGEDTPNLARWFTWLGFTRTEFRRGSMLMWEMAGGLGGHA